MKRIFDFNKAFSAFILVGMTVAIVIATTLKLQAEGSNPVLLLVAAFGSLMGILSTVCSANGIIWTFLFGLIDVSLYAVMCFIGGKWGNAFLHLLYFLPMQFVGFFQWRRRGAAGKEAPKARRLTGKGRLVAGTVLVLGSAALYMILRFTGAGATPFADAFSVVCNIIGQLLLSTAYMEQWFFWIGVNVSTIVMWSLTLSANPGDTYALIYVIKYSFYLLNALNGLRNWMKLSAPGRSLEI
ncbi:MAG: nicotinamide riboside transporter PnuC [Bacteroidales bacterium]|nr:nicotinamide riboside transporter PnuC [Bacteroidales bacterium]